MFTSGGGPIDRGKNWRDGRRILGKGKTVGGFIGGVAAGTVLGFAMIFWFDALEFLPIYYGLLISIGTQFGDMSGSFLKRRINIKSGGPFPIMDQIGFLVFGYFLVWLTVFEDFPWEYAALMLPFTLFGHLISNIFAYKMGWKRVWW